IKAYSSKRANFLKYCHEITEHLGCEVVPVHDPKEALRGAEIGATCTNSYSPVAQGDWLEPGSHIASFMSSELGRTCVLASMRPVLWSTGPLPWRKGSWTMTLAFA
ncbi:MAG: hypothetical protein QF619_07600, partial [Candidatus Binatia bacterium]|nr:hypothetical protein [Candidatus Binatia bacterium]